MNLEQPVAVLPTPCVRCGVRTNAICSVLDTGCELPEMARAVRHRSYSAGQVIMSDEAPITFLGTVLEGSVKLEKVLSDGRRQVLGLLFPSDFLGRAHAQQSPYSAIALEPVRLCCVEASSFHRLLETFPRLESSLFEQTLAALDRSREWMLLLGRKTARERVASLLYLLTARRRGIDEGDGPATCPLPLSRSEIAEFLGLTTETVSRQFGELKAAGLIAPISPRLVAVPSLEALKRASEGG